MTFRISLSVLAISLLIASTLVGCGKESSTEEKVIEEEPKVSVEDSSGKVAEIDSTKPVEEDTGQIEEEDTSPSSPSELPVIPLITDSTPLTMLSISEGEAYIMRSDTDLWVKAEVGMSVSLNDVIKAGENSRLLITFFDGSTIELQAGTQIQVIAMDSDDDGSTTIRIKQEIGNTISRVKKLTDPASRYEVETPAGTAAVRGSVMIVEVVGDGTTIITNQEGIVWAIAQGVELEIPEGRKCIIIPGQPPQLLSLNQGWPGGGGDGGGPSPNPRIKVVVTAEPTLAHVDDSITYTYDITNPGNVPLSDITVTNDVADIAVYQGGDTDSDSELDTEEAWLYSANYIVTGEDTSPLVNKVKVTGTYNSSQVITARGSIGVQILKPAIAINAAAEPPQVYAGDNITFTYDVTNTGNVPLHDVMVIDDISGTVVYHSGDTDGDGELDIGETWLYSANYTVSSEDVSPLVNTATASGTDALAKTVSAQDSTSVDILKSLATINVQVYTSVKANICIFDITTDDWAIDQDLDIPIYGDLHTTPASISVLPGHQYIVWLLLEGTDFLVSTYPISWSISPDGTRASGYTVIGGVYTIIFTVSEEY